MKKYLVTGGAGFIGSHIVERLLREGNSVRVLDNFCSGKKENLEFTKGNRNFQLVEGDIRDLSLMVEATGRDRLRVVLDIAHLFQAGYAVHQAAGLDETLDRCEDLIGLHRVVALQLNDSPTPHGSRVDRHWHLGKGEIGLEGLRGIVRHPLLDHLPAIMETPRQDIEDDWENMRTLRRLLED